MTDGAALRERTSPTPFVLVADDDAGVRAVVVEVLRELRVGVLVAGDGMAAVRLVQEHWAMLCCAILDLRMPVLDRLGAASIGSTGVLSA